VHVLKKIANIYGFELLELYWNNDKNLQNIINECFEKSKEILEETQISEMFKYVGIL
jgi:hypothetical protein